jgi:broad specificity phosphatase PhoE
MGKKSQGGGKPSGKGKQAAQQGGSSSSKKTAKDAAGGGPTRVLLLRHGQSEANATKRDLPDPLLTDLGRAQAAAWKGAIGRFGAECVLVSPLRRAIQTALLAYDKVDVPVIVCRHARELWWDEQANTPSNFETIAALLRDLPRGDEVCGVEEALWETPETPKSENASIEAMKNELRERSEDCVAVVCHWGVINALCGDGADNAAVVECNRRPNGHLDVVRQHDPPKAPRTR